MEAQPLRHCNCSGKNQTPKHSRDAMQKNKNELGTGLYLVPAPDQGVMEFRVVMVKDVTYHESVRRGLNCEAFKWIAGSVKSFDVLNEARTAKESSTAGCGNCGPDPNPDTWHCRDECICTAVYEDCY